MKIKIKYLISIFVITLIIVSYHLLVVPFQYDKPFLSPPSWNYFFGTDIVGNDVFIRIFEAAGYELITLIVITLIIWISGMIIGSAFLLIVWKPIKQLFINFIHYVATLPVLLISLFLLIISGPGFLNNVIILSISLLPTQVFFVYNQVEDALKEGFIDPKKSYGLSNISIYINHIIPFISNKYNNYSLSRLPEIIMMNLALSFLGLGIQEPKPSLGRMLFDGLSFMFSAWWTWVYVVGIIILLFTLISKLGDFCLYGNKK